MRILVFSMMLLIIGCTSNPKYAITTANKPPPQFLVSESLSLFGKPAEIMPIEEVYRLTKVQENDFLEMLNAPENSKLAANQRVFRYLKEHLKDFRFYADTLTASESLMLKYGNCLSLAILTKAIANVANVEVGYQLVNSTPVYQKEGSLILSSLHLRTLLYKTPSSNPEKKIGFRSRLTIDYFPTIGSSTLRSVPELEFQSMYYRNKAAERMIKGENRLAYWHLKKSIELNANDYHAINMLALLHVKIGRPDLAEELYLYGLSVTEDKLEMLSNYHVLLKNQNRFADAKKISIKISEYRDRNPFKWIKLANQAYSSRKFNKAIIYYKRAIRMAPYLHQPYAGIALSQYQRGRHLSAQRSMKKAIEHAQSEESHNLYQAKYDMLTQLLDRKH